MQMKDVIRQKRRERGLTQEQVAERLGVSAPAVNKWESGCILSGHHTAFGAGQAFGNGSQ